MPLTITRPAKSLDTLPTRIVVESQKLTAKLADFTSYIANLWTPRGRHGSKRMLSDATKVKAQVPGGWGVGGPIGGLLPNPVAAPQGTIARFLMNHPEYVSRKGRLRNGEYVPAGRSFPLAWWALPEDAKALLAEERQAGMYDSGAPNAHYWILVDEGMPLVNVPPQDYINTLREFVDERVMSFVADMAYEL